MTITLEQSLIESDDLKPGTLPADFKHLEGTRVLPAPRSSASSGHEAAVFQSFCRLKPHFISPFLCL